MKYLLLFSIVLLSSCASTRHLTDEEKLVIWKAFEGALQKQPAK